MKEPVRISLDELSTHGVEPVTVIHNPEVLPTALLSQVMRFGLRWDHGGASTLSGPVKGRQEALMTMIESYGVSIDIVPPTVVRA